MDSDVSRCPDPIHSASGGRETVTAEVGPFSALSRKSILVPVLVPGHKYPKMGGDHLYGRSDTHRCFNIYFFNPCFRVLMAWDKYCV